MKRLISALSSLCLAASSLLGTVPGFSASAARIEADASANTIVYDLIPSGKDYTAAPADATGNNVVKADPGEQLTVDWTVKNDQGTAGLQMTFDFSGVTYVDAERGSAYRGEPQFNKDNVDSTGEINYAYASNTERTAADDAVIYSFTIKAPESGSATIGMKTGSGINNKVVPAEDGKEHDFLFHGLTINVGGSAGSTEPSKTTASTEGSKVDIENKIIYNLVPQGKDYTAVADDMTGNNIMKATAGEEIVVDWTVKNDQGTAGLQMTFDFSGVTYVDAERGSAYRGEPQFNKDNVDSTGEINYAYASNTERTAADDAVIYSFTIKAPESGSATIGMKTGSGINNKVVPAEDGKEHDFLFHGLTINVGGTGTTGSSDTTKTTSGSKVDTANKIIYNLVPQDKEYTAVADDMTGNNTMKATAGEEIVVDWTVKNDQGTAGLQMTFDFSGVTYVEAERGSAYRGEPQFNADNANTTGEINYAYASNTERTAADDAVIYSFTIKAPESGSATIGMKTGSGINNKVVPAEDGKEHDFLFHGLTINVGGAVVTESTASSQIDTKNAIVYNFIPQGKDYTAVADNATGNNSMTVKPGEEITIDWTVKNDQGTSGIQISFDFSGVTYVEAERGSAYRGEPQFNADNANTTGEINYAFASNTERTADDDAVIYSFTIKAPESGSATIGLKTGSDITNKVVPAEDGKEHNFVFHGLEIKVADVTETTTTTTTTPTTTESTSDTTVTTKTTEDVPAGSANWKIGKETAAAGADVKVPVTVSGDEGTAGFIAEFAYDSNLKYNGITWAEGYTGTATINDSESVVVWADANGEDQKAVDNAVIMYINFTAPSAAGTYDVTFKDLQVTNTAGNALAITKEDGSVTVVGDAGSSNWKIGRETVAAGAQVKVPVTVSGDEGTAGIIVEFSADSALKFDGIEWADGYTGNATINENELVAVWADANGADQKAADNAVVLYLNFTAPTEAGEYPVEFKSLEVCNADGVWLALTKENGAVIVTDPNAGSATWIIGEEVVEAGASVRVPVTVTGDTGTAGFISEFAYDNNLSFAGIEWAAGYTGKATINTDEQIIVWADTNGANQKAENDAVVAYLLFTAPDEPGEYPVTFKDLVASNEDGAFLALTKQDGKVIVKEPNAGSANWIIGKEQAAKGATVKVPVTVKGDTGTAGFNVEFAYDQNLTFIGFEWAGEAYTGKATINMNDQIVVWADANGENQKAADDAKILYLVFTAPDETGIYPVRFVGLDTSDTAGIALVVEKEDGWVEVIENITTTTPEVTTTSASSDVITTTSASVSSGETTTTSASVSSGETTSTSASVSSGETTSTSASVSSNVTTSTSASVSSGETTSTSASVSSSETTSTSASVSSNVTTSTSASVSSNVTTTTSASASSNVTTTTSASVSSNVTTTVSSSIAQNTSTSASTATTAGSNVTPGTSTTPISNPGHVVYQIAKVEGKAGTTVTVPVYAWYDEGTAGFTMQFAVPNGLKISGIQYGDAYTGANNEFSWNPEENILVWASPDGANQTAAAGSTIVYLMIDVPAGVPAGVEYPITFVKDSISITDTDGKELEYQLIDGSITIVDKLTETTAGTELTTTLSMTDETSTTVSETTVSTSASVSSGETTTTSASVSSGETTTTSTTVSSSETTTTSTTVSSSVTTTTSTTVSSSVTTTTSTTVSSSVTTTTSTTVSTDVTTTTSETVSSSVTTTTSTTVSSSITTTTSTTVSTDVTTTTTDTTSETTLKIVTSYNYSFEPPTRVNYWSHDTRTFKESNGLKDLTASLTIYKYYVNDEGYFVNKNGETLDAKYDAATGAIPAGIEAFEEKTLDATAYTHPLESENGPKKVWENEIKAQFGENYTAEQELSAKHANRYPVKAYYFPSEQTDPDFNINNGEPVEFGEFKIYIGVKGDVNLDNVVSAEDPQLVLVYYTEKIVTQLSDVLINPVKKVDPEFEGEDGLCFYLGDVAYRDPDGSMTDPPLLGVEDAQFILVYYTDKYVTLLEDTTWESVVGYDLLDSFYGGVEE